MKQKESKCSTRKKYSRAVMLNLFQHLVVTKQRTIPECRCRGSIPYVSSSRKVSVRDIGRFFIPRTTTLRGDGGGCALRGNNQSASGFTLLEVIVAIIIIGALLTFALPKYETALDKSRFSTLMPLTKSIKDAEEVFYIASNQYTEDVSSLDVKVNPGETVQVSVKDDDDYSYVQAIDPRIENIYKAYLKHSTNFPEERHCEALTESTRANKVCESLGGESIGENGSYTVYALDTNGGNGSFEKQCEGTEPETTQTCASGCGTLTRTVSCNTRTGEWDLGDWTGTCPEQGETSQSCTSGVGTETRTFSCEGNTWVASEWDKSSCTCDPSAEPSTSAACTEGTGTQTRTNSCVNGTWVEGEWNTSTCCTGTQPATTASCSIYSGKTGGTMTRSVTCENGTWVTGNYDSSICCSSSAMPDSRTDCSSYSSSYTGGTATRSVTCNNGSWRTGSWSTSDCCSTPDPGPVAGDNCTWYYYCSSGSWRRFPYCEQEGI